MRRLRMKISRLLKTEKVKMGLMRSLLAVADMMLVIGDGGRVCVATRRMRRKMRAGRLRRGRDGRRKEKRKIERMSFILCRRRRWKLRPGRRRRIFRNEESR